MAEGKSQTFAPLPARAMSDEALAALDIRVLMALAAHDRFSINGIGCYASHPRLAGLVNCHLKSLSRSLRVLAELGYIEASQHPLNKRLRVYQVVYLPSDKAMMKGSIGNEPVTDNEPADEPIGNQTAPENEPIGNQHFQESKQFQEDAEVNILGEAYKISCEAANIGSPEGASSCDAAKDLLGKEGSEHDRIPTTSNTLGKIQTWLKSLEGKQLTDTEVDELHQLRTFCDQVEDEHGLDGIGPWAQRLAIDISVLLDEPDDAGQGDEPFFPEDRAVNGRAFTTTKTTGEGELIGEPRRFTAIDGGRS